MKTCYYELLGVDPLASDTLIKQAYKKKALQLHPDKNPNKTFKDKDFFLEIKAAYEVLIDPQERAWYDSHKNQILSENLHEKKNDDMDSAGLRHTSIDELLKYFNPNYYLKDIYFVFQNLFLRLASEEVMHGKYNKLENFEKYTDDSFSQNCTFDSSFLLYPCFGNENSDYLSIVKVFYMKWGSFLTVKDFNWKDKYRCATARDRKTKRFMERENARIRDASRKEYNVTVRNLVSFLKKRDSRVKNWISNNNLKKKNLSNSSKQKKLTLVKNNEDYVEQDWEKLSLSDWKEMEKNLDQEYGTVKQQSFENINDELVNEMKIYECIICKKRFKKLSQFEMHNNSNKHKILLKKIQWEMRQDDIFLSSITKSQFSDDYETANSGSNS